VPPVLRFIQQQAQQDDREAYSTLNMGAGFALFVSRRRRPAHRGDRPALGIAAILAGSVEAGDKQVLIEPLLGIRFSDEDLQLR
jgi:phosphoribosylformylglycinamidine cyclo-ligase